MFSRRPKVVAPKIIHPGSGNRKWWLFAFFVFVAGWSWLVYEYAVHSTDSRVKTYAEQIRELRQALETEQGRLEQYRLEAASYQRSAEIDKQAAQLARGDLKLHQEQIASLKKEVKFLNSLLTDDNQKAAIRLKHLSIIPMAEAGFRVDFTLLHLTKVGGKVTGQATLEVAGMLDDEAKTLQLAEINEKKLESMKMGFKNFQRFSVNITFPETFTPETIQIIADPENDTIERYEVERTWKVTAG